MKVYIANVLRVIILYIYIYIYVCDHVLYIKYILNINIYIYAI